jgi:hypothetical protein
MRGEGIVNQADKDLVAFYNALPNWARGEFQQLLQQADRGEIDKPQLAEAIQDLMNRAEHPRDRGGSSYLH